MRKKQVQKKGRNAKMKVVKERGNRFTDRHKKTEIKMEQTEIKK